ncbi:MAG: glycosyltransferase family 4 protein, partial [Caulobacteraceae bacterium]
MEAGHDVTVVTAAPSHPYGRVYDGFTNETSEADVEGIRVWRLKTVLGPNSGTLRRTLNYASYLAAAAANRSRFKDADIVVSTSPQIFCGLAGWPVSRRANCAWALEIRDLWPESIAAVGAARPGLALRSVAQVVTWAYRTCDLLVSVSPGFSSNFAACGIDPTKILLAPNGVDPGEMPASATFEDFPELAPIRGRFIAAYVGTFGMAHGLGTIVDAAEILKDDPAIGLVLVGSGAERDSLADRIRKLGLTNLVLMDQQPRQRIARLWSLVDASIVHLKDQDVFKTVIPTKLLEAMGMGRPVLLGVGGEAEKILTAAGSGVCFPPENAPAMAAALRR